jgi:hypothetical protein
VGRTERVDDWEESFDWDATEREADVVEVWLREATTVRLAVGQLVAEADTVTAARSSHCPQRPSVGKGATEGFWG